jgi:hypothetical protein
MRPHTYDLGFSFIKCVRGAITETHSSWGEVCLGFGFSNAKK